MAHAVAVFAEAVAAGPPVGQAARPAWINAVVDRFLVALEDLNAQEQARSRFDAVAVLHLLATTGGEPALARTLLVELMAAREAPPSQSGFEQARKKR